MSITVAIIIRCVSAGAVAAMARYLIKLLAGKIKRNWTGASSSTSMKKIIINRGVRQRSLSLSRDIQIRVKSLKLRDYTFTHTHTHKQASN